MTDGSTPDLSMYTALIDDFLAGDLPAPEFDSRFFDTYKSESRGIARPWRQILSDLFFACEDYVERPELRDSPEDLDEDRLLDAARTARARLADLGI